ncbi:GspMb/PilO family protein [uncultured Tateyamaria sp.]|uniref:GspMb/PilO family protein n=1 Tax=Tateyamaria sp. 1078 TaxID=3417464 RepID=UPI002605C490|nr:GspMb/PilO family protein [uncultured Tateyamaria sp.]
MMRSRAASLSLLAGVLALVPLLWFGLWQPAQAWKEAQFTALADAQQRSAALAQRIETLSREAAALSAATQFDGVWQAANAGEATARVQAQLSDLARQNGITFRAISPLRTEAIPLKNAVSFRVEAEARLDQLTTFLRAAEYASPVLVFEKGSLRRLSRPGPPSEQPILFFQFDVLAAYDIAEGG